MVLLWNNKNIGQVGRDAIGDALEKNETLTMLDLNFYLSDLSPKIDQYIKRNRALNHVAVNAIATFYALGLLKSEDDALQLMARADAVEKKNLVLRHSTQINKVGQNNNNNNNGSCSYKHK